MEISDDYARHCMKAADGGPVLKYVQANGLRFAYLEQGRGPLVMFMHGFPDNAWSYRKQMQAFAEAGFHVVCDKPLVHTREQADALVDAVARKGTIFGVTYNYTGYPMVRQAREMVRSGELGEIRKIVVEYNQGWLATRLEGEGNNLGASSITHIRLTPPPN